MSQKPSTPKGTRDFSPQEMVRRNYIFDTIKQTFQLYGYLPIETPAMENLSTLMGKYGEEGDKLIFKILNSGDFLKDAKVRKHVLKDITSENSNFNLVVGDHYPLRGVVQPGEILKDISEKALKYDLTVPFARYVVQHQNEITFPFKRYQIQPVWRADRPQKGRYREFYQCDADVIGSNSLINEVELIQIIDLVFKSFGLPVKIKINNRKILQALSILIGEENRIIDVTLALDKYDKIGEEIYKELEEKCFNPNSINELKTFINQFLNLSDLERIPYLKKIFSNIPIGMKGVEELEFIFNILKVLDEECETNVLDSMELDLALARGLNYYTGAIFEVKVDKSKCKSEFVSSITGGGRYDDLTGIFGLPNMSGVGISFGADRIYDVLEELDLFPKSVESSTKVLFVAFNEFEQGLCLKFISKIRANGINSEIYPDWKVDKGKKYKYAEMKKIPFVISFNEKQELVFKNITSGEKEELSIEKIIGKLK